jgi:predicted DNA-binding transcriptional regulator AlpA
MSGQVPDFYGGDREELEVQAQAAEVVDLFTGRRATGEQRLTKAQLAKTLGYSEKTVERWMYEATYQRGGRGVPFEKPFAHGGVRFVLSEVQAWLRS